MNNISYDQMKILLDDISSEENFERLFNIIFADDHLIDKELVISFLQERVNVIESSLNESDKESIKNYIKKLRNDLDEFDYLLIKIQETLINPADQYLLLRLDYSIFWTLFSISIKKCISSPLSQINNVNDYYSQVTLDTPQLRKAHKECIDAFNLNSDRFSLKTDPMLKLFLHSFHSKNKKIRTRKKNLQRVLKTTKKVMQAKKINDRLNPRYNIFEGKTCIVPDEFTKYVIKYFT